jgi:membrane protein implicated in regulation of membrane protease activity
MASKMKMGQALIWLGGTLFVIYLNTFIVWLWPDASLWAFGVVVVLGVVFVTYVYRTTRDAEPEDGEK